jgi:hypothetical protein
MLPSDWVSRYRSARQALKRSGCVILAMAFVWSGCLIPTPTFADDATTVANCPGQAKLPVTFKIDCSNVREPATKQLCAPFIRNQACKVFPAYRKITGINLETICPSITFTIYDADNWPHGNGDAGGLAGYCKVQYLAQYSIQMKSAIGPYDVHELLHEYQIVLGALPTAHILFGSSMAEATREIGDAQGYADAIAKIKHDATTLETAFEKGTIQAADKCPLAETVMEETLYLEKSDTVYQFYRRLVRSKLAAQADREARFNRMFDAVSGGKAKSFLIAHGCAPY